MGWLTQFFHLSKGERYGFWLLVAFIVIGLTLPHFIEKQTKPAYEVNKEVYERQIKQFMAASENSDDHTSAVSQPYKEISYFHFNPNKVAFDSLLELGVPEKLAHTIINYRQAGGRFNKKSDLKAVYGMPDSIYERLKPCIAFPKKNFNKNYERDTGDTNEKALASKKASNKSDSSIPKSDQQNLKEDKTPVPLNKADSAALTKVRGIGDFFAAEIVSRRKKLGGYTDFRQLLGIYNFDSSTLKQVKPHLSLNTSRVQKLSLNNSTFDTFLGHPLLDYPQVKAIFNYKEKVDSIRSVQELKSERILGRKTFRKIKPYLKP